MVKRFAPARDLFVGFDPTDPEHLDQIFVEIPGVDDPAAGARARGGITLYVSRDGSADGDGGEDSPYRQPSEALASIPDGVEGDIVIECLDDGIKPALSIFGDVVIRPGSDVVEAKWTEIPGRAGTGAEMSLAVSNRITVSGLSGMSYAVVGKLLLIEGANDEGNNTAFEIIEYTSPTEIVVRAKGAVGGESSVTWKLADRGTPLPSQEGSGAAMSSESAGVITVSGLSGMTPSSVGNKLILSGTARLANNNSFEITAYHSPSSVSVLYTLAPGDDENNGEIEWREIAVPDFTQSLVPGDAVSVGSLTSIVSSVLSPTSFRLTSVVAQGVDSANVTRLESAFKIPYTRKVAGPKGARITVVGRRDEKVAELSSLASLPVDDKVSVRKLDSGGYTAVVGDGDHWLDVEYPAPRDYRPHGYSVLASTSPVVNVLSPHPLDESGVGVLRPLDTPLIGESGDYDRHYGSQVDGVELVFIGVKFILGGDGRDFFHRSRFHGCAFSHHTSSTPVFSRCVVEAYDAAGLVLEDSDFSGIASGVVVSSGTARVSGVLRGSVNNQLTVMGGSLARLSDLDFEGSTRCVSITQGSRAEQVGDITVSGGPPRFLEMYYGCGYERVVGHVTGETLGVCVVIRAGDLIVGIIAAADGRLSNALDSTQEVIYGDVGPVTFGELPSDAFIVSEDTGGGGGGGSNAHVFFDSTCSVDDEIGHAVYVLGPSLVEGVDIRDDDKVNAVGLITDKPTPTTCKVQVAGLVRGVLAGLTPGARYFVGDDSLLSPTRPVGTEADPVYVISMGTAVSPSVLALSPSPPVKVRS